MSLEPSITRTIEAVLLPPGGLILLLVLTLIVGRSLGARLFTVLVVAVFYLLSTSFGAGRLATGLEIYRALPEDRLDQYDAQAILVLGAGRYSDAPEYGGDTVNALMLERLRYAAHLHRLTQLPLIVSGGAAMNSDVQPEAALARRTLETDFQVPVVALETRSRTTRENARYSGLLLRDLGIKRIFLVTHAWHMSRALQSFEDQPVQITPAPTGFIGPASLTTDWRDWLPSASAFWHSYLCLHEYLGALWYRLT
jgi:uncharacterized SAM-binding protein YcdF (DUF218 family)